MKILIYFYTIINDSRGYRKGNFPVNIKRFNEDPDKEAARVAFEWLKQMRRESSYDVEIWKVTYNEIDITNLVKEMDEAPLL